MLFNSFEFAVFFPIVTILFFLIPHKFRWFLLLLSSCIFYMYFKPEYILILALIIVVDYVAAIKIDNEEKKHRKKLWLTISLIANLGILFVFKYFNFFIENLNWAFQQIGSGKSFDTIKILLPIGLSFHTLQAMSYTIEVSRGKVKPEKNFGIYALYVMFYPQLVAGPIERPQNLIPQFHKVQKFSYQNARMGMLLIAWGLFKKVVIADRLASFVNQVHSMPNDFYSGIPLVIAYIFCPFQVYCDFSGYTDIATGCARFMGYNLMTNFKTPMLQPNVNKYWATWHISLTSWFRDYVYLPIRKNIFPNAGMWLSILVVLVLSGIWHGANWNFIFWGVFNALIVIAYNAFKRNKTFLKITDYISDYWGNVITCATVFLTTIFFRSTNLQSGINKLINMFLNIPKQLVLILKNTNGERLNLLYLKQSSFEFLLSIGLIIFLRLVERKFFNSQINFWLFNKPKWYRWSFYYFILIMIVFFGVFKKVDFIYFQF